MLPPEVAENRSMQRQWEIERMANGRSALFREGLCEQYDLPYLQDGDPRHTLDLIRPERAEGKLPVILEIHGGGYIACEKNINRLHSRAYAQMGFAVVNGDYTLHPEGDFLTDLWELAAIVNWVADAAEENGFDLNQVYMSGDSAGGHLKPCHGGTAGNPARPDPAAGCGGHLPGLSPERGGPCRRRDPFVRGPDVSGGSQRGIPGAVRCTQTRAGERVSTPDRDHNAG